MGRESANRQRPKDLAELIGFVKLIDLLEGSHNRAFRETDRGFRSPSLKLRSIAGGAVDHDL